MKRVLSALAVAAMLCAPAARGQSGKVRVGPGNDDQPPAPSSKPEPKKAPTPEAPRQVRIEKSDAAKPAAGNAAATRNGEARKDQKPADAARPEPAKAEPGPEKNSAALTANTPNANGTAQPAADAPAKTSAAPVNTNGEAPKNVPANTSNNSPASTNAPANANASKNPAATPSPAAPEKPAANAPNPRATPAKTSDAKTSAANTSDAKPANVKPAEPKASDAKTNAPAPSAAKPNGVAAPAASPATSFVASPANTSNAAPSNASNSTPANPPAPNATSTPAPSPNGSAPASNASVPPAASTNSSAAPNVAATNTAAAPAPPTAVYRVGIGDVLNIRLLNQANPPQTLFTVMAGGLLEYPLAGDPVVVSGMTAEEIAARLASGLKKRAVYERPQVVVNVHEYASHAVLVSGMVGDPGTKILRREAVPLYVVLAEAQPHPEAGRVIIISHTTGQSTTVDLSDAAAMNTLVHAGDVVNVQARPKEFFYIGGEIAAGGQKDFHQGLTLTQALLASGGATRASSGRVKVARQGADGRLSTTEYSLKDIEEGRVPDPRLQPGDRIEVVRKR